MEKTTTSQKLDSVGSMVIGMAALTRNTLSPESID